MCPGNLACYKYLRSGREDAWFYPEEIQVDEDPDEIVRVRGQHQTEQKKIYPSANIDIITMHNNFYF